MAHRHATCTRGPRLRPRPLSTAYLFRSALSNRPICHPPPFQTLTRRHLHSKPPSHASFAFAFEQALPFLFGIPPLTLHSIDGVLLRSAAPIPGARSALAFLQKRRIPFLLLTNGGGKLEAERVADVGSALGLQLDPDMFVQSHSPFAEMVDQSVTDPANGSAASRLGDACVLVVGGESGRCRSVAESYGYKSVITPSDIYASRPSTWPFSAPFASYHRSHSKPLPLPLYPSPGPSPGPGPGPASATAPLEAHLRIAAVHVYNDPRDWGLDLAVLTDILLSHQGYVGTLSGLNGRADLPNRGYLQDGQPEITFSNPDLWWAAEHHLARLGQGGFKAALRGVWHEATAGAALDVQPGAEAFGKEAVGKPVGKVRMQGKPHGATYAFAERRLRRGLATAHSSADGGRYLKRVYMVGDNPLSDIRGANAWTRETAGNADAARWRSVLVRSGVYTGGKPAEEPEVILKDVREAVGWALGEEGVEVGDEMGG